MNLALLWLRQQKYPELWEAVDEALVATALNYPDDKDVARLSQSWLKLSKRTRAHLHGQLRAALQRRMPLG